jgi:hypothetical protein
MSSRLHNKYHRHNHHTTALDDPRYPDASYDPIASYASPFLGDFVLQGSLSATQINEDKPAIFTNGDINVNGGITVTEDINVFGDINATGNLSTQGTISAADISFQGANVVSTFDTPLTAVGDFLLLTVNGQQKALRLWTMID